MNATLYAADIAKNVFQIHWVDADTGEIRRRKLSRTKFAEFFAKRQPGRVAMEACGGAHHWGRMLTALGWQAELLPAGQVRPFVRGNKDDAADAHAIWVAAQQSDMRRVAVKSVDQQAALSLHRMRSHWITARTATLNAVRGLLYEFGVILPKGREAGLKAMKTRRADIDARLPAPMVRLLEAQLQAVQEVQDQVLAMEKEIALCRKSSPTARRLLRVPGIGPLGATALAAVLGDGSSWRNAREFACSLGLAPGHTGTGGRVRTGGITKRGDPYLRTLLVSGAHAVIERCTPTPWITEMLKRRPKNVVAVAVAHKLARTAWALVAHQRDYDRQWQSAAPLHARAQAGALAG